MEGEELLPRTAEYIARRENEVRQLKEFLKNLPAGQYVLELGCGHGHFLAALAQKYVDEKRGLKFLGVDKNAERIERAQKKTDRAGLEVKWLNAKVEDVMEYWPAQAKLVEVFILFPDPWPKAKHHKHRFVNEGLLSALAPKMSAGGSLYFRTDNDEYFAEGRALLEAHPKWQIDGQAAWPEGLPATVFEGHHPVYQSVIARVS